MIAKDEKLLVKVLKKAVGLPAGNSSCGCGVQAPKATNCCSAEATESASTGCDCEASTQAEDERPAETA